MDLDLSLSELSEEEYREHLDAAGDIQAFRHVYEAWPYDRIGKVTGLFPKNRSVVVGYFAVLTMDLRKHILDLPFRQDCRKRLMTLLHEWAAIPQHARLSELLETISKETREHDGFYTE